MDEKALPGREEQRDATSIPKTILEEKEIGITENYNAEELLEKLAKGELSAEEVTKAFCRRAAVAHKLVSCFLLLFTRYPEVQGLRVMRHKLAREMFEQAVFGYQIDQTFHSRLTA